MVLSLSGMSVAFAIHSLHIFHRSPDRPIPPWQARVCRVGARIMSLRCASERPRSVSPISDDARGKKDRLSRLNDKAMTINKPDSRVSSSDVKADMTSVVSDKAHEEMSWQLVAQAYDAFFLRLYFALILCSCVCFTLVIASNQF